MLLEAATTGEFTAISIIGIAQDMSLMMSGSQGCSSGSHCSCLIFQVCTSAIDLGSTLRSRQI